MSYEGEQTGPLATIRNRIASIRERTGKATPGPWYTGSGYEQSERGNYVCAKPGGLIVCAEQDKSDCVLRTEDADFIAHAREDIPWLADEAERAIKMLVNLEALTVTWGTDNPQEGRYLDTLYAKDCQIEMLRAALQDTKFWIEQIEQADATLRRVLADAPGKKP